MVPSRLMLEDHRLSDPKICSKHPIGKCTNLRPPFLVRKRDVCIRRHGVPCQPTLIWHLDIGVMFTITLLLNMTSGGTLESVWSNTSQVVCLNRTPLVLTVKPPVGDFNVPYFCKSRRLEFGTPSFVWLSPRDLGRGVTGGLSDN